MKAVSTSVVLARRSVPTRLGDWTELVKLRLSGLVLLTTLCGLYVGARGQTGGGLLINTLLGTALVAFGAAALNQFQERHLDAKMRRTADRPLPAQRMSPETALRFGLLAVLSGTLYLGLMVNTLTAVLGAVTVSIYNLVYTPLKRVTWMNTLVGAIPGALPPVMGWTAARGELNAEAGGLFAILFFWQIPHFLSIAWLYREDYARAGFIMLPQVDPAGWRTGQQALLAALGLALVSLLPALFGLAGRWYLGVALLAGAGMSLAAAQFRCQLTAHAARRLFYASLCYLPLVLSTLALDRLQPSP